LSPEEKATFRRIIAAISAGDDNAPEAPPRI
jgi:hypothetical protein